MLHVLHLIINVVVEVLSFLLFTVVIKIIVGHWAAEEILKYANKFYRNANRSARTTAIWQHYQDRAKGYGHHAFSVLDCMEEGCEIFKTSPASLAAQSTN